MDDELIRLRDYLMDRVGAWVVTSRQYANADYIHGMQTNPSYDELGHMIEWAANADRLEQVMGIPDMIRDLRKLEAELGPTVMTTVRSINHSITFLDEWTVVAFIVDLLCEHHRVGLYSISVPKEWTPFYDQEPEPEPDTPHIPWGEDDLDLPF